MTSRFYLSLEPLRRAWSGIIGKGGDGSGRPRVAEDLPSSDAKRVRRLMDDCLAARGGEVSARQRAAVLGELYLTLNEVGRKNFLLTLAEHFTVDREQAKTAARNLLETADDDHFQRAVAHLQDALVPPRQRLLRQFNALPQGIKFLVDLRADLLSWRVESEKLAALDRDLKQLLATWFDIGLLTVRRIDWQSPAALLEKLMAYEAVHAISSWKDLHNRLESDRHCYAFFHPGMPNEPLIFIEVALVEGLATSIQTLLDEKAPEIPPEDADTAIFYSISNTQQGLQGISFGPFLIKQVVTSLRHELPNLKTFSTLSPIPGFNRWLTQLFAEKPEARELAPLRLALEAAAPLLGVSARHEAILDSAAWGQNPQVAALLKEPLLALAARYLHEPRTNTRVPLDPVARFHLGNGARIEQLNWLGDTSAKGMREACGMMVNYLYQLKDIEKNIEAFATGEVIATTKVRNLLKMTEDDTARPGLRNLLGGSRGGTGQTPKDSP